MRSIHGLYKSARDNDNDDTDLTALETKVDSHGGVLVGSNNMRISNVASPPATVPSAGTTVYETTRKVPLFSDGTSMFLATGSLA